MKDQWKGFALSIAVGLILGGGLATAIGERNLQAEATRIHARIDKVEVNEQKTFDAVYELALGFVRMEEQLKRANEKLDALAR